MYLFFSEENLYRGTGQGKALPEPVLNESLIGFLNILGKVAEKGECGIGGRDLGHVLDLDVLPLDRGWGSVIHKPEHNLVQL